MRFHLIVLACILASLVPAAAQEPDEGDDAQVAIVSASLKYSPVVDLANVLFVGVENPTSTPVTLAFTFQYADGEPVSSPRDVPGSEGRGEVVVDGGARKTFQRQFTSPASQAGENAIIITATSPGITLADNGTYVVPADVAAPRVTLEFVEPPSLNVTPGGVSFLRYTTRNEGNLADDVLVSILDVSPGWEAFVRGTQPNVSAGTSANGTVIARALVEDAMPLHLNVSVDSGKLRSAGVAPSTTAHKAPVLRIEDESLRPARATRISGLPTSVQVLSGEDLVLPFTVANGGDERDVLSIASSLVRGASGWEVDVDDPQNISFRLPAVDGGPPLLHVGLEPGEERNLTMRVNRVAATASPSARVFLNASSTNWRLLGALHPGAPFNASANLTIRPAAPDLAIARLVTAADSYPGGNTPIVVEIGNLGRLATGNATLSLTLRDNAQIVLSESLQVPALEPGGTARLTWSPRTAGLPGTYLVAARILITAADATPTNDAASATVVVRDPRLAAEAPQSIVVRAGERLVLSSASGGLAVVNEGNHTERVVAELTSDAPWLSASWRLDVPPGARQALPFQIDVPGETNVTRVTATLRVRVDGQPTFNATAGFTVTVTDSSAPTLEFLPPDVPARLGASSMLALSAEDPSGIASAEIDVVDPDGKRVTLRLAPAPGRPGLLQATFTPTVAGAHRLEFRARDASPDAHLGLLTVERWTVTSARYDGLVPLNFMEASAVATPLIRFSEVEPGTTALVEIDWGEGRTRLDPPYEVLTPWSDGPHTVRMWARSVDGTLWEATWNVTLMSTPPRILDASVRSAGTGRLELSAHVEGGTNVTARFTLRDGATVDVSLDAAGGNGTFRTVASPPADWATVTFLASDPAGNRDSRLVLAESRPLPTPAALSTAAAVAIAAVATALLGRRHRS